jgi:hypothetical protein
MAMRFRGRLRAVGFSDISARATEAAAATRESVHRNGSLPLQPVRLAGG